MTKVTVQGKVCSFLSVDGAKACVLLDDGGRIQVEQTTPGSEKITHVGQRVSIKITWVPALSACLTEVVSADGHVI